MRSLLTLLMSFAAAMLVACAQTSTTTRNGEEVVRSSSDAGDPEKRAAVRLELAGGYFSRGQYDTALEEIRQALAAKPDLGAAYNMRGLIYAAMGDARLAEESFQRALALNPRDADAMHNRAWFLCQQGRYDEADAMFEQTAAQPQYRDLPRTLMAQGLCQARAGKMPSAEQKLLRSYELDPSNPATAYALADVLYRRNDLERARFYIRRVNGSDELSNAQSLWLAARIENRAGNRTAAELYGRQLRARFPQSPEARALDQGRFDD